MRELVTRIAVNAVPIAIALLLAYIFSKTIAPIGRYGAVGIYLIGIGCMSLFDAGLPQMGAVVYSVASFIGLVLVVADAGGRFRGRGANPT